ncbi:MAG: patatin-like phospholipase family protein [Isosphaeraceae bacterium]|nr:patatin-like phospholipase family protein [Isosphaeraceae bacterium]
MTAVESHAEDAGKPVTLLGAEGAAAPASGIALCLSGGGYRAMVFHLGVLWRLNDAGLLGRLDRISSVSGGSITAAWLAGSWRGLALDQGTPSPLFRERVIDPIRRVAGTTIDVWKARRYVSCHPLPGVLHVANLRLRQV